jgi:hypothetical protein
MGEKIKKVSIDTCGNHLEEKESYSRVSKSNGTKALLQWFPHPPTTFHIALLHKPNPIPNIKNTSAEAFKTTPFLHGQGYVCGPYDPTAQGRHLEPQRSMNVLF